MTSTPLLAWQGSLMRAVQLTFIPTLGVNILMIVRQSQPWQALRPFLWILPAMVLGTIIGSFLLIHLEPDIFQALLAFVIIVFLWLEGRNHLSRINHSGHPKGILITGLITGILVGNVNAGVPVLIIFSLYNQLDRNQSIVLFNSCFLTGKITQLILFANLGELNADWQRMGFVLLFIAITGVMLGQWLGRYIDQARWRAAMRWVLLAIAISLLLQLLNLI